MTSSVSRSGASVLLDTLLLCTGATVLGVVSLAIRLDVPWTPPPPDPASVVCGADEPIEGIAPALARIAVAELRSRVVAGDVVLVDARSFEDYARGHIPGAISLPADEIDELLASQSLPIPNDRDVVTYCARPDGLDAEHVGRVLDTAIGCPRVFVLDASPSAGSGWQAWIDAGAPVEGALQSG